jgi:hypothetical protein
MNINRILNMALKAGFAIALVIGFISLGSSAVQAQYGGYGRSGGYGGGIYQIAQQNGYNDGLRKGQEDAREGHNNPTGTNEYRRATNGYDSRMGDRYQYQQAYRQAFLQGFAQGQNQAYNGGYGNNGGYGRSGDYGRNGGYGNYPNNGGYGRNTGYGGYGNDIYRVAQQNGYNDGLRKGQQDAREGHNNPTGTNEYRRATNGYDSRMGDRYQYQQAYRQGFLQGFSEGQSYGRYGNRGYNSGGNILRQIIIGH